mmetsp:Transcript_150244/g.418613  ORF Transcript_150244/g.418613 Transcript_150244/m.418613 type:complete len:347 (-) Transcript_150244:540-1580(-)
MRLVGAAPGGAERLLRGPAPTRNESRPRHECAPERPLPREAGRGLAQPSLGPEPACGLLGTRRARGLLELRCRPVGHWREEGGDLAAAGSAPLGLLEGLQHPCRNQPPAVEDHELDFAKDPVLHCMEKRRLVAAVPAEGALEAALVGPCSQECVQRVFRGIYGPPAWLHYQGFVTPVVPEKTRVDAGASSQQIPEALLLRLPPPRLLRLGQQTAKGCHLASVLCPLDRLVGVCAPRNEERDHVWEAAVDGLHEGRAAPVVRMEVGVRTQLVNPLLCNVRQAVCDCNVQGGPLVMVSIFASPEESHVGSVVGRSGCVGTQRALVLVDGDTVVISVIPPWGVGIAPRQ